MKIFNVETKSYEDTNIKIKHKNGLCIVRRSSIPRKYIKKTDALIYIVEFLKCDGTLSIINRGNNIKGELLFISTNKEYRDKLKTLVKNQFPDLNIFDRKDGFGLSCLSLALLLAVKYNVPIGKKTLTINMFCQKPKNFREAKIILSSIIDSEGNIDPYSGDISISNTNKIYLDSIKELLINWFSINVIWLSDVTSGYSPTSRIGIIRDNDIIKLSNIEFLNDDKKRRMFYIKNSLEIYKDNKIQLIEEIKVILSKEPLTIKQISVKIGIAPFVIRRLLRNIKAKKVGIVEKNKRKLIIWSITSLQKAS